MLKRNVIGLALIMFFGFSCDNEEEKKEVSPDPVIDADPSLNKYVFTARYENVYAVDAQTGESIVYATFKDGINVENTLEFSNDILYCITTENVLYAFNTTTGEKRWSTALPEYDESPMSRTNPVFYQDRLYAGGIQGIMVAIDATTGGIAWQYDCKVENEYHLSMKGSPVLYQGYLLHGTASSYENNHLHCVDSETGELIWKVPLGSSGVMGETVAVAGDLVYVPGENFEARSLQTGELVWSFPTYPAEGASKPVVAGDKVLFHGAVADKAGYARLYCLDRMTGEMIWSVDSGQDEATRVVPQVADGYAFGCYQKAYFSPGLNGRAYAVSLETGEEIWKNDDLVVLSDLLYANGRLFFQGLNLKSDNPGSILCLNAVTGELLWEKPEAGVAPVVVAENGVFKP